MIGPHRNGAAGTAKSNLLAKAAPFVMYKMEINVSGQLRVSLFRGPGCRKTMLDRAARARQRCTNCGHTLSPKSGGLAADE